jgi:lichenan operon transcriptional antiterminator
MIPLLQRHKLIIEYLINRMSWTKASEISKKLDVSDRTIRDDIKLINEIISEHNLRIESSRGKGYRIREKDKKFFSKLISIEQGKVPILPEERIKFIIERLLAQREGVDLFYLAEEMLVSEQTIELDIKRIKNILKDKHLGLKISRKNNRFFIEGEEIYQRYLLCSVVMDGTFESLLDLYNYSPYLKGVNLIKIKNILLKNIEDSNFVFSDLDLVSLIIHCAVSVQRMKQNFYLESEENLDVKVDSKEVVEIAKNIAEDLNKEYGIIFNELEIANMAQNISLKKASLHHQHLKLEQGYVNETSMDLVGLLLEGVRDEFNLDLTEDKHLKVYLSSHIDSLIKRISHNRVYNNPYLDEIKNSYPYLFEIAVFIRKRFYELTNMIMREDEIGYIAIHLGAAVERQKAKEPIKKVALVSHASMAYKQLLYNKLQNLFSHKVKIIGPFPIYEIDKIKGQDIDMIISTVRLPESTNIPNVIISTPLTDGDVLQIKKFIDDFDNEQERKRLTRQIKKYVDKDLFYSGLDFKKPNDVIEFMSEKMIQKGFVPKDFKELVFKREKISPTSFDNLIAMPHSIESNGYKTGISVLVLKEPMKWSEKNVQIVFMFSLKKGEHKELKNVYRLIQELVLGNRESVKKLIEIKNFDEFIEELVNLPKKERK